MIEAADTVIRLTPPGVGAIAVVRLSGSNAPSTLAKHFAKTVVSGRCVYGNLARNDQVLDDIVVVQVDSRTFDLNIHGGDWIVRSVIDLFVGHGFVITHHAPEPGDSLMQTEMHAHLPHATTEQGVRLLLAQELLWNAIKAQAARGEDVVAELRRALTDRTLERLLNPPRVAIVGPANVGKSTLANQLFGSNRSITADVPGTTRDWVGELANIDGLPVMLVDTPGIRTTSDAIEHAAIQASRQQIEQSQMIVLVLDATRPLAGEQQEMLPRFADATVVVNKADRAFASGIETVQAIHTVAITGGGVDQLRREIVRYFCGSETLEVVSDLKSERSPAYSVRGSLGASAGQRAAHEVSGGLPSDYPSASDSIHLNRPSIWTSRQRAIIERALLDITALSAL